MRLIGLALLLALLAGCEQLQKVNPTGTPKPPPVAPPDPTGVPRPHGGPVDPTPAPAPGDPTPKPADPSAVAPVDDEFQGYHLDVEVNGTKTEKEPRVAGAEQLWKIAKTSGALTVRFAFDEKHMGVLKGAEVVVNPLKDDGSPDRATILRPAAPPAWIDNASLELGRWHRFAEGGLATIDTLPPGRYVLHLTINGERTWDRQSIHFTVE